MRRRVTGEPIPAELAVKVAEPKWVQVIRTGWKRLYGHLRPHTA